MREPPAVERLPLLLVHGGIYDDTTALGFWTLSGVTGALDSHIVEYEAPNRPDRPANWHDEARALLDIIESKGWSEVAVVAASNGCSAALRLAVDHGERVRRLVLGWPATTADAVSDELIRAQITELGPNRAAEALLSGDTIRGLLDSEIERIAAEVVLWPSVPENQFHQASTVIRLAELLPRPLLMAGSPDPTHPEFDRFRESFVSMLIEVSIVDAEDRSISPSAHPP